MAKSHDYVVSFSPAESWGNGLWSIKLSLLNAGERFDVQASSLPELETKVRSLAAPHMPCSPYVRLKDRNARKPPGFDRWANTIHIIA